MIVGGHGDWVDSPASTDWASPVILGTVPPTVTNAKEK